MCTLHTLQLIKTSTNVGCVGLSSEENKKFAYISGVTIMNKWDVMLQEELKKQSIDLYQFVQRCCASFPVTAQQVIDHLLAIEDEQYIINGDTTADSLHLFIELWIDEGMSHKSGKVG
jgi:hypothetical protein